MSIKENISHNLIELRKLNNLTQQELADKLNYTSKAISKWEHGDALPDIEVLSELCEIYDVTLNDIVKEDLMDELQQKTEESEQVKVKNIINEIVITALSLTPVWFIATGVFVFLKVFREISFYPIFILSFPVSFILLIIFNGIWGKRIFTHILVSCFVWSIITAVYCTLLYIDPIYRNIWSIFFLGVPIQIAIALAAQLKRRR